jgi:hypothetical protein
LAAPVPSASTILILKVILACIADAVGTRTLAARATLLARVLDDFHKENTNE